MSTPDSRAAVEDKAEPEPLAHLNADEIRQQLERVVASVHFRNSKRYPAFLRFIVEETLDGREESLKERTLGVEVFGRVADYDTNLDPVVRVTAGEIRKRIAQYYQSPQHEFELRFDLPLGSYVPHFLPAHALGHEKVEINRRSEDREILDGSFDFGGSLAGHSATSGMTPAEAIVLGHKASTDDMPAPMLLPIPALPGREPEEVRSPVPDSQIVLPGVRSRRARLLRSGLAGWNVLTGVVGLVAALTFLAVGMLSTQKQDAGLTFIWGPLLRSKQTATIVLGAHSFDRNGNDLSPLSYARLPLDQQTALASMIRSDMVPLTDVVSYSQLISLLARSGALFRTQSADQTTIDEFRHGPLILVGAFDNMWTMRLTSPLRYRFVTLSDSVHEIQDARHPENHWSFDNAQSVIASSRDYALVARFFDPQLEQHVLVVAGIGKSGTEAAAEFVTDKRSLQTWLEAASADRQDNVEIVLSTDLVEGKHGPPHVIASYRW